MTKLFLAMQALIVKMFSRNDVVFCTSRRWYSANNIFLLVLFCIFTAAIGCGDGRPTRVPVSGRVLIDGKPLTYGAVRFVPPGDRPSGGNLDSEGRFTLMCFTPGDGAVLGTHQVAVSGNEQVSQTRIRWHAPKKYADFNQSGLTQEITGPTDSVLIELSWDGGKPFVEIDEIAEAEAKGENKHNK